MRTYNLLVVDDSPWIREGITASIDWAAVGVNIVGEAEEGYEALKVIAAESVDIVISDIRMDYLDGLSLAKKIREKYPHIQVIIISGYSDFEYAQKGIRYGVTDYLLKPIKEELLIQSVKKCIEIIKRNEKRNLKDVHLEANFKKSIAFLRKEFLKSVLSGNMYTNEAIEHEIQTLNLKIVKGHVQVFVVVVMGQESDVKEIFEGFNQCLNSRPNLELLIFEKRYIVIIMSGNVIALNKGYKDVHKVLAACGEKMWWDEQISISTTVGQRYQNLNEVYLSYKDALEALASLEENSERQVITQGLHYIQTNFMKDISLEMLAEYVDMNPSYFGTLFKKEMNISFSKYLVQLRMNEAKKLLKRSSLKVYEVSELVGYGNYRYFSRIFKKNEGCTPLEYRENKRM